MSAAIQVDVASRTVKARGAFSIVFSFVLLTIVVTGFMPTFFLNAFMAKRPIPIQVLLHGLAATSWFVLLCFQSLAIYRGRTGTHRRVGSIGFMVALVVLISITVAAVMVAPRLLALGLPQSVVEQALGAARTGQIIRDAGAGFLFSIFVLLALRWRRDPETHKRLMMHGSIVLSGAAIGRLGWIERGAVQSGIESGC